MLSSRDALSSLQAALTGVRRDEDRLTALLNASMEEATRLRTRQAETFRALARMRLDAIRQEGVTGALTSAERRALQLIDDRKDALARAVEARKTLVSSIAQAQAAEADAATVVEKAIDALDERRAQTQARLKGDAAWQAAAAATDHAAATAKAAADKAARSEAEKDGKKQPYEADDLFIYLWQRGFGTSAYTGSGLTRMGDAWVARLIGYEAARQDYFMLNQIPLRLREHADRLAGEAAAIAEQQAKLERAALVADGVEAFEADLKKAQDRFAAAQAKLDELEQSLRDQDARSAAAESGDPVLREALDEIAQALSREDLRSLQDEALKTPTPEDEKLVAVLRDIAVAMVRVDSQIEETRKTTLELARRRTELERSQDGFRRSGYDDPMGGFVNDRMLGEIIGGIVGGVLRSRDLEQAMRDGFRRRETRSSGGFGGNWPGGSGGFGGGFGGGWGGGSSSGGGGGGFRTGGGF
ncbi:MAG: hypothetical protein ACK50Q_15870 [Labrys sp. (in: a-proteobacteria)]